MRAIPFWAIVLAIVGFAPDGIHAEELTFVLRIERGRVTDGTRTLRAAQGDTVRLLCQSDRAITVHLHGYDIEREIKPGDTTEISFTARLAGRFPLYAISGESGGHAHQGAPLAYVEVRPR
ncbi:MAG: hypothetical protein FJX35_04780 [Alphaproteobacteria bacterium]|nr:hypothetical protein [Alphaproteobacteria bacterium]